MGPIQPLSQSFSQAVSRALSRSHALYSVAQIREFDRVAIEDCAIPGFTLMERAAAACVEELLIRWPDARAVLVLCGSGNNAGDGFVIAGLLAARGLMVKVVQAGRTPSYGTDADEACQFCLDSDATMLADGDEVGDDLLEAADVIVDALLGTGLNRDIPSGWARLIRRVNQCATPVLSVDVPSGLSADTGQAAGDCIKASVTVTFIGRKLGLYTNDAPEYVGELVLATLGIPEKVYDRAGDPVELLDYERLLPLRPLRHRNSHKMNHGHLLLVGGDDGMAGAVVMAAEAALHTGAGLVSVATRQGNIQGIVARCPEAMARGVASPEDLAPMLARASAIVLGPGLGQGNWGRMMYQAVINTDLPLVLDADGLNLLAAQRTHREHTHGARADNRQQRRHRNWVLTPHPGEAARLLTDGGKVNSSDIQADRQAAVLKLQAAYAGVTLLKGAGTLIAGSAIAGSAGGRIADAPEQNRNDAADVCLNPYGNPGMAAAGMGDVLSGVIGSLLAQGLSPWDAARLGAVVHSLAADRLVAVQGERGLLATQLPAVMRSLLNHKPTV